MGDAEKKLYSINVEFTEKQTEVNEFNKSQDELKNAGDILSEKFRLLRRRMLTFTKTSDYGSAIENTPVRLKSLDNPEDIDFFFGDINLREELFELKQELLQLKDTLKRLNSAVFEPILDLILKESDVSPGDESVPEYSIDLFSDFSKSHWIT